MAAEIDDLAAGEVYQRAIEDRHRRDLLYALPILEHFQQVARALDVTSHNLVGAAEIEHERKTNTPRSRRPYRFALTPRRELPEDEEHDARIIADSSFKALNAIAAVIARSLKAALSVLESQDPEQRKFAAEILINQLISTIERLLWLSTSPGNSGICTVATERTEFPSIISLSRKINNDREDLILDQLSLGKKLPFRIDPRTTYTPYTRLAMQIVAFIDTDRRRKGSIYRKVVPDLHKMDFAKRHYSAWNKVIGFHLDFFQSPQARRKKFVEQQQSGALQKAMTKSLSSEGKRNFVRPLSLGPFCEIAEMIEFRFRDLKETKKAPGDLYNQVKHKVIDAALALLQK